MAIKNKYIKKVDGFMFQSRCPSLTFVVNVNMNLNEKKKKNTLQIQNIQWHTFLLLLFSFSLLLLLLLLNLCYLTEVHMPLAADFYATYVLIV